MFKKLGLLLIVFLLTSCSGKQVQVEFPKEFDEYTYVGTFINGDEIYIDAYKYNMQDAACDMVILSNNKIKKRFSTWPTRPKLNKERNKMLYIDELQFEAIGNVVIYDSESQEETVLTAFDYNAPQETVKDVEWYTEDTLLCIVGYGIGTITQGGELYSLHMPSKELKLVNLKEKIKEWTDRPYEIVDLYIENNALELTLVEWRDDNYMDYYYTVHHLTKDELLESMGE